MAGIKDLSVTAAENNAAPPDGAPEGMDANVVNNTMRQTMALLKGDVVYRVPLLADLKALDSTKQVTGNGITLTGLTVVGSGGGVFYYDSTSSATSDDIDVVTPTDGLGRWLRPANRVLATSISASGTVRKNGTHPAVSAFSSSTAANATGDGTIVTINYNTEIKDQGGDFDISTDIFTAPVSGLYTIGGSIRLTDLDIAHDNFNITIVTSNRTYLVAGANPFALTAAPGLSFNFSMKVDMDANDTATVTLTVSGGTKVVDISGSTDMRTSINVVLSA